MHGIHADAAAAANELKLLPVKGAVLPSVDQFIEKLEYEFTPSFFHGGFWLGIARTLGITRRTLHTPCGKGHLLFFRMRGIYRRTRDFADPEKRKRIPDTQLEDRRREAFRFCDAFAHVGPV